MIRYRNTKNKIVNAFEDHLVMTKLSSQRYIRTIINY